MVIDYLRNDFQRDLHKINLFVPKDCFKCRPEECIWGSTSEPLYFGDNNCENIFIDIKSVDKNNYKYFFVCLFIIILIDWSMNKYNNEYYKIFREKTLYPKFGNSGFGFTALPPQNILAIAEKHNLIKLGDIVDDIDEYIEIFINDCTTFFKSNNINKTISNYLEEMLNDKEFEPNASEIFEIGTSKIFKLFREKLNNKLQECDSF
jgi:hypothetical protein